MKQFRFRSISTFRFIALFLIVLLYSSIPVDANDVTNRFNSAMQAFKMGQFNQAQVEFSDFLAKYPNQTQTDEATFYLAESFLNLQQYDAATACYDRLVNLGLNNQFARVAMFRLGDIPYIQGQFAVAKPRLEKFIEQLPHDNNLQFVLYYLGDIAMRDNAPLEAEHYFGQCERMFPNGAKIVESRIGLAWAKNHLGNTTAADEIFRQLLASPDPKIVEPAMYQWGVAQFERNDNQDASTTLTTFLNRYPGSPYYADAQRVLARCKGALKDYQGALQIIAQISQPSIEDTLLKVRCLYGMQQTQEAYNLLLGIERTAGPIYADEIAVLKSVFFYDQKNWQGTIDTLTPVLQPSFNVQSGKMMFNYASVPTPVGGHKLSDESFLKACALLAIAYAQNGDSVRANATLSEMNGTASLIGGTDLQTIVSRTSDRLSNIYAQGNQQNGNQWGNGQNQWGQNGQNYPGGNQWNNNNSGNSSGGTDMEKFMQAAQLYTQKNWSGASQTLEQLLGVQYNNWTKQCNINYNINGRQGSLNETTFVQACSLLTLSKAQQGDFDQAGAVFTAFSSRAKSTDSAQQEVVRQTQNLLNELAQSNSNRFPGNNGQQAGRPGQSNGGNNTGNPNSSNGPLYSDADQRQILRTCNSLYNARRFDQIDSKLSDLIGRTNNDDVKAEAMLLRGKALFELGKERNAVQVLEDIVINIPSAAQCSDALWYLGYYYEFSGDSFKALEYFQLLADQFPNYKKIDGALYFLALDDLENGNGRKANSYLTRVYRNHQSGEFWSHATWTLAAEAYKRKDYDRAELYLRDVLQHPPDYAILDRALYLKGDLALKKKEFETALVAFREVGKLCPDSPLRNDADKNAQVAGRAVSAMR